MVEIELLDDDSDPRDFSKMLLDVNIYWSGFRYIDQIEILYIFCVL